MAPENRYHSYNTHSHWRNQLMQMIRNSTNDAAAAEINIGESLQELRILQGLSLRALAELSGLNVNTLSLIENEKTSPNVSTLQQLATALNVPITTFFESVPLHKSVVFQKAGERSKIKFPQGAFEDLGAGLALGEGTPLLMILSPNEKSDPDTIIHTGQEFVYCLEGSLMFYLGKNKYLLEPGDSLIFEAHIPHRWENRGRSASRSILIICPSDHTDRTVSQHLIKKTSAAS